MNTTTTAPRAGYIGEEEEEIELEPLEVPGTVPAPVTVPEPEKVPA